jgi:hypothetical protein
MTVPFAPGPNSDFGGPPEKPPASHVGRPLQAPPIRLDLKGMIGASIGDVLPERAKPRGEPTEEPEGEPSGKVRRNGRRRRGR